MKIPGHDSAHLTYCLNVHPGETWKENREAIRGDALRVREAVAPGAPFGLGLRLGRCAAETLNVPEARREFKAFLESHGLYVFTINGFPYGEFHGRTVKTQVYRPDWTDAARLTYTVMLSDILADLLPDGMSGSISTVPGSYKAWIRSPEQRSAIVENLATCVLHLDDIRRRTGREIHLGLEPEPDCLLEGTDDVLEFFEYELWTLGSRRLCELGNRSLPAAEATLRRHLGVCFDACHLSVQFETLSGSLQAMQQHGIRISKMQLSAALGLSQPRENLDAVHVLGDSIYLHQVKARDAAGRIRSYPDLPAACEPGEAGEPPECEWRIHCHVPLYFEGREPVSSTAGELTGEFLSRALGSGVEHLEIETYTFDVLPDSMRKNDLVESIGSEYRWVLDRIKQEGGG